MTDRERFVAVATFQTPDYIPIFGFPGAPGMAGGALKWTHQNLVRTGMPAHVGGSYDDWQCRDVESWYRYWGTTGPLHVDFTLEQDCPGWRTTTRVENGYEIIESETGAITRQVVDNANIYIMPEYVRYDVRDRASWEFVKDRLTPRRTLNPDELARQAKRFEQHDRPLFIHVRGVYGFLRGMFGPEALSYMLYDDPELIADMVQWMTEYTRRYRLPLIERLRPDVVHMGEDLCYNHGMLWSPEHFRQYAGPYYRMVSDCARASGVPLVAVDSDGNVMEFIDTAVPFGLNMLYPFEVKSGNDLFELRRRHPRFVCAGWLEKEIINEGNESQIDAELMRKVPPLLKQGGYFPNGDHGIQPPATFRGMCRFMTLLHELCGNPEGEFPRG